MPMVCNTQATFVKRSIPFSKEVQQKLNQHKPETIGQASRIQGITPAAISLLLVWLKRSELARGKAEVERP